MWGSSSSSSSISGYVAAIMVAIELSEVGLNTVSKAALRMGMSEFVFVFYSNAFALFFLLPSTFFFYRKRSRPQLTCSILCKMFVLALLSCSAQMLTYIGIGYSSPTLASAMTDLTPAFTFLLAIIFGMEKLKLRVQSSQAKFVGTIVSISGALIVTLYKGPSMITTSSAATTPSTNLANENELLLMPQPTSSWVIGGFFLAGHSLFLSLIFILQTWIVRDYPAELMVTVICCTFVTVLSGIVSLIGEKDPSAWILKPNTELIAIGYSAVFAIALKTTIHTWVLRMKGPVYVSMFKPLGMVIAIFMGVTLLGDVLHLGSVVGAGVIALGFYAVIWGQAKEDQNKFEDSNKCHSFESSSLTVPILQNKTMEI